MLNYLWQSLSGSIWPFTTFIMNVCAIMLLFEFVLKLIMKIWERKYGRGKY